MCPIVILSGKMPILQRSHIASAPSTHSIASILSAAIKDFEPAEQAEEEGTEEKEDIGDKFHVKDDTGQNIFWEGVD